MHSSTVSRIVIAIQEWQSTHTQKLAYVMVHPERAAEIYREFNEMHESDLIKGPEPFTLAKNPNGEICKLIGVSVRESIFCPLTNSNRERIEFFLMADIIDGHRVTPP